MTFSKPIHRLKAEAKAMAKSQSIPHNAALDLIAQREGFVTWSLLAAHAAAGDPTGTLLSSLRPGDLALIGARPGHGKTRLALSSLARAQADGAQAAFYSLEYTRTEAEARFSEVGGSPARLHLDTAEEIDAARVCRDLRPGWVVVIDYLQLLDQRRSSPPLGTQLAQLRAGAHRTGAIVMVIAQIARGFETSGARMPGLAQVRLPNPADLSLFDVTCFLHDGAMRVNRLEPA